MYVQWKVIMLFLSAEAAVSVAVCVLFGCIQGVPGGMCQTSGEFSLS